MNTVDGDMATDNVAEISGSKSEKSIEVKLLEQATKGFQRLRNRLGTLLYYT